MKTRIIIGNVFDENSDGQLKSGLDTDKIEYLYIDWKQHNYQDDPEKNTQEIYSILTGSQKNILIDNADSYVTYLTNNCLMRKYVDKALQDELNDPNKSNVEYATEVINKIPIIEGPVRIIEIDDVGNWKSIQRKEGFISQNWFDQLMKKLMNDFYNLLNFYE